MCIQYSVVKELRKEGASSSPVLQNRDSDGRNHSLKLVRKNGLNGTGRRRDGGSAGAHKWPEGRARTQREALTPRHVHAPSKSAGFRFRSCCVALRGVFD